ncbi:hypothetical protein, partial [Nocardia amamiensis]|uniref:hypothetical protein n=1 Tax=Nocardia amamiensis TaxID=404578 RepID=UPI0033D76625
MSASLDNGPELPIGLVELVGPVDPVGVGWLPVESKPLLEDEGGRPLVVEGLAPSPLVPLFPPAPDPPLLLPAPPPLLLPPPLPPL